VAAGNEAMSESEQVREIRAHQRIWQSVHDKATAALDAFGTKDYRGRADYWIVDDDWGPDLLQVEINNPRMLRRDAIGALKRVLDVYPQWQIIVRVFSRKDEAALPPMGLLISDGRVFDHLNRDYLPAEFRHLTYEGL
jgi:hypothetical protein